MSRSRPGTRLTLTAAGITFGPEGRVLVTRADEDLKDRSLAASFVFDPQPSSARPVGEHAAGEQIRRRRGCRSRQVRSGRHEATSHGSVAARPPVGDSSEARSRVRIVG